VKPGLMIPFKPSFWMRLVAWLMTPNETPHHLKPKDTHDHSR